MNSFVPSGELDAEIAAARRAVADSPDSVQARVRLAALSEAVHDLEAFIHYKQAFWLGSPVVTKMGESVSSREGLSILANLGLRELVARDDRGYIEIARRLAADREYLAGLRANLPKMMEASPLMDSRRYTGNLEAAYRQMWESWCAPACRSVAGN